MVHGANIYIYVYEQCEKVAIFVHASEWIVYTFILYIIMPYVLSILVKMNKEEDQDFN